MRIRNEVLPVQTSVLIIFVVGTFFRWHTSQQEIFGVGQFAVEIFRCTDNFDVGHFAVSIFFTYEKL